MLYPSTNSSAKDIDLTKENPSPYFIIREYGREKKYTEGSTAILCIVDDQKNKIFERHFHSKEEMENFRRKYCVSYRGKSVFLSAFLVRTNSCKSFLKDFFLPTTIHHTTKASNGCQLVFGSIFGLVFDIVTLGPRALCTPFKAVYDCSKKNTPHPIAEFLQDQPKIIRKIQEKPLRLETSYESVEIEEKEYPHNNINYDKYRDFSGSFHTKRTYEVFIANPEVPHPICETFGETHQRMRWGGGIPRKNRYLTPGSTSNSHGSSNGTVLNFFSSWKAT